MTVTVVAGALGLALLIPCLFYSAWGALWFASLGMAFAAPGVPVRRVRGNLEGWEIVEEGHVRGLRLVVEGRRYSSFHDPEMVLRFRRGLPVTLGLNVFQDVMTVVLEYDRPGHVAEGLPPA